MDITYQNPIPELDDIDQVCSNTASSVNQRFDRELFQRLVPFSTLPRERISARIAELENEWDIE